MIIAVDFDGILCEDQFPDIGPPIEHNIDLIKLLIKRGHEVILWTCRVERPLLDAIKWCEDRGITFCAINENAPSNLAKYRHWYDQHPRKVYADVYIDDHGVGFTQTKITGDTLDKIHEMEVLKDAKR